MAKVNAPLLSFGGSGTIAKSVTFGKWRGINYARQHVVPANPNTTEQQTTRSTFALLREMWKLAPVLVQAPWDAFAQGRPFTGMNKFVGENLRVVRGQPDFANFIGSPGARGGLPPQSVTPQVTPPSGTIVLDIVAPTQVPTGWTLQAAVACAFKDQDPAGFFVGPFVAGEDTTSSYSISLDLDAPGEDIVYSAWLRWQKPDESLAYSVGLTGVTPAGA